MDSVHWVKEVMDDQLELWAFNGYYNAPRPEEKHTIKRPPSRSLREEYFKKLNYIDKQPLKAFRPPVLSSYKAYF